MLFEYPYTSNYLEINGYRLHYLDEGDGPVVVMLHGNPTWSFYYRHLVSCLSRNFRVIVPDHIGCGLSDKPQKYPYTLQQHIANLSHLLKCLDIRKMSLVVHDWGGAIGMGYAVEEPDKIAGIVILNTAAFRSKRIPLRIRLCRLPVIGTFLVRGLNAFAWPATFMAVCRKLPKKTVRSYLKPYNNWSNRVAIAAFVKDIPLEKKHTSYPVLMGIENRLETLRHRKIPMVIIWGGRDFCFDRVFFQEWRRRFPEADYHYLNDYGHYVLEDGHGVVEPIIHDFLTSYTADTKDRQGL